MIDNGSVTMEEKEEQQDATIEEDEEDDEEEAEAESSTRSGEEVEERSNDVGRSRRRETTKRSNKRLRLGCRAGLRCLSRSTSSPSSLQAPLRGRWRAPFTSASCGEKRALGDPELSSVASLRYACSSARGCTVTVASQPSLCRHVVFMATSTDYTKIDCRWLSSAKFQPLWIS